MTTNGPTDPCIAHLRELIAIIEETGGYLRPEQQDALREARLIAEMPLLAVERRHPK